MSLSLAERKKKDKETPFKSRQQGQICPSVEAQAKWARSNLRTGVYCCVIFLGFSGVFDSRSF